MTSTVDLPLHPHPNPPVGLLSPNSCAATNAHFSHATHTNQSSHSRPPPPPLTTDTCHLFLNLVLRSLTLRPSANLKFSSYEWSVGRSYLTLLELVSFMMIITMTRPKSQSQSQTVSAVRRQASGVRRQASGVRRQASGVRRQASVLVSVSVSVAVSVPVSVSVSVTTQTKTKSPSPRALQWEHVNMTKSRPASLNCHLVLVLDLLSHSLLVN